MALTPGCLTGLGVPLREDQGRDLLLRRILVEDDHVDERRQHRGERRREQHVGPPKSSPTLVTVTSMISGEQRRPRARGLAARSRSPGSAASRRRRRRPSAAVCHETVSPAPIATRLAASGPITGTISRMPAETPISSQYGRPISPEGEREHGADERDHEQLLRARTPPSFASIRSHVSTIRFRVLRLGEADEQLLRSLLLEDPVRRDREREEDPDEHLERRAAVGDGRVDQVGAVREPVEPVLEPSRIWCLIPCECLTAGGDVRRARSGCLPSALLDLVERARDDQPEQQRRSPERTRRSGSRRRPGAGSGVRAATRRPAASPRR